MPVESSGWMAAPVKILFDLARFLNSIYPRTKNIYKKSLHCYRKLLSYLHAKRNLLPPSNRFSIWRNSSHILCRASKTRPPPCRKEKYGIWGASLYRQTCLEILKKSIDILVKFYILLSMKQNLTFEITWDEAYDVYRCRILGWKWNYSHGQGDTKKEAKKNALDKIKALY